MPSYLVPVVRNPWQIRYDHQKNPRPKKYKTTAEMIIPTAQMSAASMN